MPIPAVLAVAARALPMIAARGGAAAGASGGGAAAGGGAARQFGMQALTQVAMNSRQQQAPAPQAAPAAQQDHGITQWARQNPGEATAAGVIAMGRPSLSSHANSTFDQVAQAAQFQVGQR